ncbi:hypothetical protein SASPL_133491 [Salvia splendens]|uniref:Uncharacterized protein n=1 Tax=Salvia splendens TaxID=180675 RepID=A0A8X8ZI57_SALSN|nr:hypothetical protein SASPL_133491 [Salvia splendens]
MVGCLPVDCSGEGRKWKGGLCILWDEEVDFKLMTFSTNHILGRNTNHAPILVCFDTEVADEDKRGRRCRRFRFENMWLQHPQLETIEGALEAINTKVIEHMNESLSKPYTKEEINRALRQMHPSKAPGPDARSAPPVSHLFFADDSILFCRASEMEALALKNILRIYEEASGQKINLDKSELTRRNEFYFEKKWFHWKEILLRTHRSWMEMSDTFERDTENRVEHHTLQRWKPPPTGTFIMNSDINILHDGQVGLGVIFRDEKGMAIFACKIEVKAAGLTTLMEGIVVRYVPRRVHVVDFKFIPRACNRVAHLLSRSVAINSIERPMSIHDFTATEKYAVIPDMQIVVDLWLIVRGRSPVGVDRDKVARLGVIPKYAEDEAESVWIEAAGFNPLHCVNAWDEDGGDTVCVVATNAAAAWKYKCIMQNQSN